MAMPDLKDDAGTFSDSPPGLGSRLSRYAEFIARADSHDPSDFEELKRIRQDLLVRLKEYEQPVQQDYQKARRLAQLKFSSDIFPTAGIYIAYAGLATTFVTTGFLYLTQIEAFINNPKYSGLLMATIIGGVFFSAIWSVYLYDSYVTEKRLSNTAKLQTKVVKLTTENSKQIEWIRDLYLETGRKTEFPAGNIPPREQSPDSLSRQAVANRSDFYGKTSRPFLALVS